MVNKIKIIREMIQGKGTKEIARGFALDGPEELHLNRTGKKLKFVVMKGYIDDWCVYAEDCFESQNWDEVRSYGHKVPKEYLKTIIEASNEVWSRYRS